MLGIAKASSTRQYRLISTTNITSTGAQNYTIPAGVRYLEIEMWGGGGGGGAKTAIGSGRSAVRYAGGGGGGGGYLKKTYYGDEDMQASDLLTFIVGAGGAGGAVDNVGVEGGTTTLVKHTRGFSTINGFDDVACSGGQYGAIGTSADSTANGGGGGDADGGDINTSGDDGDDVVNQCFGTGCHWQPFGGIGGDGGGAGGGVGGAGAKMLLPTSTDAVAGTAPGGGGGGGSFQNTGNPRLGAAGGDGKVIVKAYG